MNHKWGFAVLAVLAVLSACKADKKPDGGDAAGSSSGGEGGEGPATGGKGGGAGTGQAGSGNAAGTSGAGGSGGQNVFTGSILGPVTDDQQPLVVGMSHAAEFPTIPTAALLTNAAGDFFLVSGSGINKYDSELQLVWSATGVFLGAWGSRADAVPMSNVVVSSVSVDEDGGLFFGGKVLFSAIPGATSSGGNDALIGRLAPDGTLAWIAQWGTTGDEGTTATVSVGDGVLAAGDSTGQAPDNPSTTAGGDWLARFQADGTLGWLKQYPIASPGLAPGQLFTDGADDAFAIGTSSMRKVDSEGKELWMRSVNDIPGLRSFFRMAPPTADSLYSWGDSAFTLPAAVSIVLGKHSLSDGALGWYRTAEPERTVALDAAKTWKGKFQSAATATGALGAAYVAIGTDAIYLAGIYDNSYLVTGGPAMPAAKLAYVGRYDLEGNRVWFQEFLPEGASSSGPMGIALDEVGTPTVLLAGDPTGFLFKLNPSDGTIQE